MGDVVQFKRPDGRPPLSAYARLMIERAVEEMNTNKPIVVWQPPKKDGVA
jgi:hypothetical protein